MPGRVWLRLDCVSVPGRLRCATLEARGRLAIVGPNGGGKTSLLLVALRHLKPSSGHVEAPDKLGYSPQNPYLSFRRPTVAEELAAVAGGRSWAIRLLRDHDLEGLAGRSPFRLSMGEARLVSILAALAWGPEALLLDEPTSGLSQGWIRRVALLLDGLDIPFAVAGHDLLLASALATEAAYVASGRVVEQGPPGSLKSLEMPGRCVARCALGLARS